ncbi:hypothetical protein SAMN04488120_10774 [Fontimonas thermophila]|uniref:Metallo-beta-lactamase superfamily protein n=1 Tax=Fontimonas thermophila TaxID=1076937 RepID=A0A1I2JG91_9GAMM|nr:hypothetical protein [Fontimonas thermophila]SFF53289.1 hypothetical protein SAMN04488120_10774 [Fontimonas thermophila]
MSIIRRITHFDGTRAARRPRDRVENVRAAAQDFRREMLAGKPVPYYRSMELVRVPYPARYGYLNGFGRLAPYIHLCNRLFVVQFRSAEGLKTLLVSPSDWEHQRATPFFKRLTDSMGPFAGVGEALVFKKTSTVLQRLAEIGLAPEDVDYITYDHLHTQNLTRWLGGNGHKAIFPNAKLLVMREEWESAHALIPWQNQWYCPGGLDGIPQDRVILLDHDVMLGEGVALIRTKGHTEGNHSIVVHTPEGLKVTSENGVSLDAYAPQHSSIPGLAEYARATGAEVVLNGNTLEYGVDQYISMVQEKAIAGPWPRDERLPNIAPSSESAGYWLFPRTAPTFTVGDLHFGRLQTPVRHQAAA